MSSDQMIQFARVVGLEVALATFGMLEYVLLKIGGTTGRNVGDESSGQSPSFSWAGFTIVESVASRSFCSLPTITESFGNDRSAGDLTQQPCCSQQADAALDFPRTEVTEINDTDSLKTLGQIRSDARKKGNLYKWSRECRHTPISPRGSDDGGYVFTQEMLEIAPIAKIFATGPENPLKNCHCFFYMICRSKVSLKLLRGLYDLKRHFQREHLLRADQRFRARYHPSKVRGPDGRTLYDSKLEAGGRKAGVQNPFTLTPLQFERLLHKPSFSVMGRIDMCSMLRALLLRLNGLLDERWVQSTQSFRKVRIGKKSSWSPWEYNFGMIILCFVGPGKWKDRVVYCVSCSAGIDHSLASDCRIH